MNLHEHTKAIHFSLWILVLIFQLPNTNHKPNSPSHQNVHVFQIPRPVAYIYLASIGQSRQQSFPLDI